MSSETANPQPEPDLFRDQLVAYLDGELTPEASQAFERRLSEDPDLRRQLQLHQQTWDLLDAIPRVEVNETFTQTTVEMIAVSMEGEVQNIQHRQEVKHRYYWLAGSSGAVLACALGFFVMSSFLAAPNRQLVEDLPVIENLDAFRSAQSVDFLRALKREGLFVAEVEDDR
ncbi:MAG: anti-sigma factor [Pirellulaceae bacterium]